MRQWVINAGRGLLMGLSDSIPGVSGGTVALILGIYPRLIEALGSLRLATARRLLGGETWRRIARGLRDPGRLGDESADVEAYHLLFLGSLGVGALAAIVTGARYIPTLLDLYPAQMRGLFLGLVLASVVIPVRMMKVRGGRMWILMSLSAAITLWFVGLPESTGGNARGVVRVELPTPTAEALTVGPQSLTILATGSGGGRDVAFGPARSVSLPSGTQGFELPVVARMAGEVGNLPPGSINALRGTAAGGASVRQTAATSGGVDPALWIIFLGGMVAISAMMLPGISGSFVLLLLGLYHYVTYSLSEMLFSQDIKSAAVVITMVSAIGIGLLTFSRVLRWLFARAPDRTLAVLVGLMLGSLRKLWPFVEMAPDGREILTGPGRMDGVALSVLLTFSLGVALVLVFESFGRRPSARGSIAPGPQGDAELPRA